ncbi:MAG: response regulator [Candidatus Aminicenantes bacterium]|nr:response regulator [Candidatus Aminicenantes bacterium]
MKKRILLVDDESSLRRTLALGLSQRGYDTEPCENGVNALKKLDLYMKNDIGLGAAVLDIRLPDIDGIKLAKIIKFKYPGLPVILITGHADLYNPEEIKNLKVSAFLEKPFSADELSDQFDRIMRQQQDITEIIAAYEEKEQAKSRSTYMLIKLEDDADFFETHRQLHYMENVLFCDATKGDYDIFLLVQAENREESRQILENKIRSIEGIKEVEYLEVESPVLDEATSEIIQAAEDVSANDSLEHGKSRDMSKRVSSYLLMEVEKEKLDSIYLCLRLKENVVYCDYTVGKYNLVLLVTGSYFDEIDKFVEEKVIDLDGVLKVKEYPIVNLYEM